MATIVQQAPQAQMSFSRSTGDHMTSFDSGPPSFSSTHYQSQASPYPSVASHSHSQSMSHQSNSFRNFSEVNGQMSQPAGQNPQIYTAVYSSVAVYEMEIHGVAVMRRRSDSWLNATQILKVAGVDKGKRTKILEKEILTGEHEKIQGGYGKYQGTWINYQRGREFCRQYGVEDILRPLLDYDMGSDGTGTAGHVDTPTKEQAMAANRKRFYNSGVNNRVNGQQTNGTFFQNISPTASNALAAMNKAARFDSPMPRPSSAQKRSSSVMRRSSQQQINSQDSGAPSGSQQSMQSFTSDPGADNDRRPDSAYGTMSGQSHSKLSDVHEPPRKKLRPSFSQELSGTFDSSLHEDIATEANDSFVHSPIVREGEGPLALPPLYPPSDQAGEEKRLALLDLFADSSRTDFSNHTAILHLSGQDLDIPLDASANTALHWAATLARVSLVRLLISKGANIFRGNAAGQTPLMAAVQVNNNFDQSCFPEMLEILGPLIEVRDATGRTVLHHIAVSSGIKGRSLSSRYYLESLLEFTVRKGGTGAASVSNSFDGVSNPTNSKMKPIGLVRFMSEVVNVQDKSGNTALNLVARIGNQVIINQLEEVGADYTIPNNTGFRPTDFGIFPRGQIAKQEASEQTPGLNQAKVPNQIDQIKEEIFATTTSILSQTQSHYQTEIQKQQDLVDQQNAEIRDIAHQHKLELERYEALQRQTKERSERKQKIANLRRVSKEHKLAMNEDQENQHPDALDLPLDEYSLPSADSAPDAQQTSFLASLPSAEVLRARLAAYTVNNQAVEARVAALKGRNSELEAQYRRVVSLCTGVPETRVEGMLEGLVAAVESEEREGIEVGRVREFLRKVEGVEV